MSKFDKAIGSKMIKKAADVNRSSANVPKVENIDISLIDENPDNEQVFNMDDIERLKRSIKESGLGSPIIVFKKPDGRYEISSGHRRVRALRELGAETVPCLVNQMPDDVIRAKKLLESNITNRTLKPLDYAHAIDYYIECVLKPQGYSGRIDDACADFFGISTSSVYKLRSLLKMTPELQEAADDPRIPYTALVSAHRLSPEMQSVLAKKLKSLLPKEDDDDNGFSDGPSELGRDQVLSLIRSLLKEEDRYRTVTPSSEKTATTGEGSSADPEENPELQKDTGSVNKAEDISQTSPGSFEKASDNTDTGTSPETMPLASAGDNGLPDQSDLFCNPKKGSESAAESGILPVSDSSASPADMALQKTAAIGAILDGLEPLNRDFFSQDSIKALERISDRIQSLITALKN